MIHKGPDQKIDTKSDYIIMSSELSDDIDESCLSNDNPDKYTDDIVYGVDLTTCDGSKFTCDLISYTLDTGILEVTISNNHICRLMTNKLISIDINLGMTALYHTHYPLRTITVSSLSKSNVSDTMTHLTLRIQ